MRCGSASIASSSSENLTVARIWRAHLAGSVASSAVIHVPVTLLSSGVCGARSCTPDRKSWNSGTTASIELECAACDTRTRRASIPCSPRRWMKARMGSSDPATTQLAGSFTTAMSTPGTRCSATALGPIATATMAPAGDACRSWARFADNLDRRLEVEDPSQRGRDVFADAVSGLGVRATGIAARPTSRARIPRRTARDARGRCVPMSLRIHRKSRHAHRYRFRRGTPRRRRRSARRTPARSRGRAPWPFRRVERPAPATENDTLRRSLIRVGFGCLGAGLALEDVVVLGRPQHRGRLLVVVHDRRQREVVLAASGQREGDIGQVRGVWASTALRPALTATPQAPRRFSPTAAAPAGRSTRHAPALGVLPRPRRARLFPPTPNELTPARRTPSHSHAPNWLRHDKRGLVQPQFRVRAGVVQRPGDRLVLQAENRFDQTCDPGGDFQVADVGLDRP